MIKKLSECRIIPGLLILFLSVLAVWGQEKHWLVGIWKGEIADFQGAGGPSRTLNVADVGTDGTVQATWGTTGNVNVTLNGDIVMITPNPNTRAELKRVGNRLEGTFTAANGRSYPFQLSRILAHRFAGLVQGSGRNCGQPLSRNMEVEQIGDSVRGTLEDARGAVRFSGKMEGASFEAKRTSSRNETQTITGKITADEMAAAFDSPGCTFMGTLKKQP